ncbi:MAG TPA: sigma-54-dependent Fis family transcriptional regulator [Desulfobacteraceae bacterium]|nr:sigma-54-dependent Fis family transcriptional regulator [Desulfobacteraceae bacterium]|tara:strand:+ start:170 stop:1591 length:1422 start_codon:yes stop_codon:yes gene_type:complete
MTEFSILVVDDDTDFLNGIIRHLKKRFDPVPIIGACDGRAALEIISSSEVGVLLSDLRMPGLSGHELLEKAAGINPRICTVMITGYATVEAAVQALKAGAWDFITKPLDRDTLYLTVEKAVQHYTLARENKRLKALVSDLSSDLSPTWESRAMKQLQEKISAIAITDYTVLVTGESGAGKEFIAREIHRLSHRSPAACHALNCPAIPEQLLESELFGHVKGAFTGAERNREGFFLAADKGTLILDEIGDISLPIQAKLLKFLQDKEVKPVGSSSPKITDVRIIALTNRNLEEKIRDNSFRQDLFYRLNVLSIVVPPLRDRREDIPILVRKFIGQTSREMNLPPMEIHPSAMAYLARQPWPGNVRELLNYVRRLTVFSNGQTIDLPLIKMVDNDLGSDGTEYGSGGINPGQFTRMRYKDAKKEALDIFSRDYLTRMFEETRGNISETSRRSGLERASIQKIIKRLDLDMSRFRQ